MNKNMNIEQKNIQLAKKNEESLNSETGYKDTGNDAQVHGKARAIRNGDNGSH